MKTNDTQLIEEVIARDRYSTSLWVDRQRYAVYATALRALGNADDAQDVAQEALIYAVQSINHLRDLSKAASWRGTRRLGEPMTILNEITEEEHYIERLAIRQALDGLSDSHRTTLLLYYEGGWSLNEVAEMLDIPVNTVRSRLMAAKRQLYDWSPVKIAKARKMSVKTIQLNQNLKSVFDAAFPNARILNIQQETEPYMPFAPRIEFETSDGNHRTIDIRLDIDPKKVALNELLKTAGIPGPRIIHGPVSQGNAGFITITEPPLGIDILHWALGGTPHRIRLASESAFNGIERLQSATEQLMNHPNIHNLIESKSLYQEAAEIEQQPDPFGWLNNPWFKDALVRVQAAVKDIDDPLVLTHYLHFFPNWMRIGTEKKPFGIEEPLGWPGDERLTAYPIVEYTFPFGYFGDPLLGLAMIWCYDCYPFIHAGYVEQYLWRRGLSRRDIGPRLALRALQTIYREVPVQHPVEDGRYWDALRGYTEQGLSWL